MTEIDETPLGEIDEEVARIEQEMAALKARLEAARQKKARAVLDRLEPMVEALGDLVDLHESLDEEGRAALARFHNRVQERFADMGLGVPLEAKRPKTVRPVVLQG